jgi:ribonuclease G
MLNKVVIYRQEAVVYGFGYIKDQLCYVTQDYDGFASEAVFNAKISKINHAEHSAFIDYSPGKTGFVNLAKGAKLQDGASLLVQLAWLGDESKQAKFRPSVQLVGKYVVAASSGISSADCSRASATQQRETLSQAMLAYPAKWTLRSSVKQLADIEPVMLEIEHIGTQLNKLALLSSDNEVIAGVPNYLKLLRSLPLAPECLIISNDKLVDEQLLDLQDCWLLDTIEYNPQLDMESELAAYRELVASTSYNLSNGASLEIHCLSGINLIDVNSDQAKFSRSKLNFLVLDAIYQQICLRNLQGIILLDLLKNMTNSEQEQVIEYLKKLFKHDITNSKVLGFSHSGLCELIRQKF